MPQFCGDVEWELRWLAAGPDLSLPAGAAGPADAHRRFLAVDDGSRERCWFLHWGPTTDNLSAHLFRAGDRLALTFEFWRAAHPRPEELGQVFVAELPEAELVGVLGQMLAALGCSPDAEPGAAPDGAA